MRTLSLVLIVLLVSSCAGSATQPALAAETQLGQTAGTPQVGKIKAAMQMHVTGENSKVKVTLGNEAMIEGNISKIQDSSFEVNGNKTGQATSISYADVQKGQGPGLSKGAKMGIGLTIGVVVAAVIIAVSIEKALHNL